MIGARELVDAALARAAEIGMPEPVKLPGPGPALLIAPHPDDEVLGAGGTLRKHVEAGDEVSVVFVTDARPRGRGAGERDDVAAARRREAEAACDCLGVGGRSFLGAPDGRFAPEDDLVAGLREAIGRAAPRVVYVPGFEERHRDHLLAAALLARAWLEGGGDWTVCAYEVWTPLRPNCVVNVTAQIDHKRAAMRCHASQLERVDYLSALEGLGAYRAALLPTPPAGGVRRFAEAFWRCTPGAFVAALRSFLAAGAAG
jgi:LmbE family N-acetylglucosaminyl deacetylase